MDVSLEELVSWDVLEQFMQDIPGEPAGMSDHSISEGLNQGLGHDTLPMCNDVPACSSGSSVCADAYPGVWPPASGGALGGHNAAALAQALGPNWQQQGPTFPMPQLAQTWGAEFLPSVLGGPDEDRGGDALANIELESPTAGGAGNGENTPAVAGRQVHKQRFVWTAELHRSFEKAVNTLGIDHAKPQAISQLMHCEGEGAPTRQNIKSHLQKYRLLMQKRARQHSSAVAPAPAPAAPSSSTAFGGEGTAATSAAVASPGGAGSVEQEQSSSFAGSSGGAAVELEDEKPQQPIDQSVLEQHLARQEMNLKVQMDLQTKLHRQLLMQRQLQHQLEHSCNSSNLSTAPPPTMEVPREREGGIDPQHFQAMLQLKNSLRERLTKHVVMQQEMLQHLDALVSSEVSKPAASSESAERLRGYACAGACRDDMESTQLQAQPPLDDDAIPANG